jgi:hypothetical protein
VLLRFAIKNDLDFEDNRGAYSTESILAHLTLIVYPRSMAGLNLNPNEEETEFQLTPERTEFIKHWNAYGSSA